MSRLAAELRKQVGGRAHVWQAEHHDSPREMAAMCMVKRITDIRFGGFSRGAGRYFPRLCKALQRWNLSISSAALLDPVPFGQATMPTRIIKWLLMLGVHDTRTFTCPRNVGRLWCRYQTDGFIKGSRPVLDHEPVAQSICRMAGQDHKSISRDEGLRGEMGAWLSGWGHIERGGC